jgi:hypothetical protein
MTAHEIAAALAAPFEPKEVKWKAQTVKNNRALAVAFVDARLVQDRLDEVLGVDGWQDLYDLVPDGSVVCRLRVRFGEKWVTKTDVGSTSEQPDAGDRLKAAFSDALKRAAVKFGIGRYLYRLPAQWVDYDPVKKQIVQPPQLPAFAIPKGVPAKPAAPPESGKSIPGAPANGQELHRRLQEYDAKLAAQKLCVRGALLAHVTQAGVKAGYTANVADWTGSAIPFAVDVVKEFETAIRSASKPKPQSEPAQYLPTVESVALTRSFIDRYGKVKSRNEVTDLDIEVGQAKAAGKVTEPQCNTIRLAAEGARKSFLVPAKT